MELLLSGQSVDSVLTILKIEKLPQPLITYLFCCPGLDGQFRCLPRAGGYLDQDYIDMYYFNIIETRIRHHQAREAKKNKGK